MKFWREVEKVLGVSVFLDLVGRLVPPVVNNRTNSQRDTGPARSFILISDTGSESQTVTRVLTTGNPQIPSPVPQPPHTVARVVRVSTSAQSKSAPVPVRGKGRGAASSRHIAPVPLSNVPFELKGPAKVINDEKISIEDHIPGFNDPSLLCVVCTQLMIDPVMLIHADSCGNSICRSCFAVLCEDPSAAKCPFDRSELFQTGFVPNLPLRNQIGKIVYKCWRDGCSASSMIEDIESHTANNCSGVRHKCPHNGCDVMLPKVQIPDHVQACEFRNVLCSCGSYVPLNSMPEHKRSACPDNTKPCSMERFGCTFVANETAVVQHEQECPFVKVSEVLIRMKGELNLYMSLFGDIRSLNDVHLAKRRKFIESRSEEEVEGGDGEVEEFASV